MNFSKWTCGDARELNVCVSQGAEHSWDRVPKPGGMEPAAHSSAEPPEAEAGRSAVKCDLAPHGSRRGIEAPLLWGKWICVSRTPYGEPSTYISEAGVKGEGCILTKEATAMASGPCHITWSVQKSAS